MKITRRRLIIGAISAGAAALVTGIVIAATPDESAKSLILSNQDVGKSETAVGDIIADAFRSAARTDIALVSAGDLKPHSTSVSPGGLKATDLTRLLMYPGDRVVTMALDGGKIRQALETAVASYAQPSLSFLQVSGVQFTFNPNAPVGQRITDLKVNGAPIVKEKSYTVAMLNSLAGGALGYWKVWSKRNIVQGTAAPVTSASAVEAYIEANPKPDLRPQNRINVRK